VLFHPTNPAEYQYQSFALSWIEGIWEFWGVSSGKLPKLNFPMFDGDNPKLWISRSEDYFNLFDLDPTRWVKIASMHLMAAASRWLPSVEKKLKSCSCLNLNN
jgi:hypothetical protein